MTRGAGAGARSGGAGVGAGAGSGGAGSGSASRGPSLGRPARIGITGPIGCGKSTVAGWLGELGAVVIDADQVARDVTPPGSPELAAVVRAFGAGVVRDDGSLDRAALGRIVFADPAALARLEAIIHPAVRPRILALMADAERAGAPGVVVEAIKLVEGGLAALCDEVWLITCNPAAQRSRLAQRGAAAGRSSAHARRGAGARSSGRGAASRPPGDGADVDARIAAQGDLAARLKPHATRVIDTSGSRRASRALVLDAWASAISGRGAAGA